MQCALLRTQLQIRYLPLRQNASGCCFISYHAFDKFPTKFFENGELPPVDTPWRRIRAGIWTLCSPRAATPGPSWSRLSSAWHSRRLGAHLPVYPSGPASGLYRLLRPRQLLRGGPHSNPDRSPPGTGHKAAGFCTGPLSQRPTKSFLWDYLLVSSQFTPTSSAVRTGTLINAGPATKRLEQQLR